MFGGCFGVEGSGFGFKQNADGRWQEWTITIYMYIISGDVFLVENYKPMGVAYMTGRYAPSVCVRAMYTVIGFG